MRLTLWNLFPWLLGTIVIAVGFYAWIEKGGLVLFPLLGIWAWSIMWTHYVVDEVRRLKPGLAKNIPYKNTSFAFVLFCILLHPSIILYTEYKAGLGLSLLNAWAVQIAVIALFIFLAFEFFDRVRQKPAIAKRWWMVNISQSLAMTLIFIHSINLGSHLQEGWFRTYWIILGIILAVSIIHTHISDWNYFKAKTS